MLAATVLAVFVCVAPTGHELLTGAAGRSYFGIMVQPLRSMQRLNKKKQGLFMQWAPCRRRKCPSRLLVSGRTLPFFEKHDGPPRKKPESKKCRAPWPRAFLRQRRCQ